MAIKFNVTKDEHAKLSEAEKAHYIEDGQGYRLDVDGQPDTGPLLRAKEREVQLRKEAEARYQQAKSELESLSGDDARKRGDIAALEKSWKEKTEKTEAEKNSQISKLKASTEKHLVKGTAAAVAAEISTTPSVFARIVEDRLTVDYEGEEPKLRILDKNGQPSAMTIAELKAEFLSTKDYAGILTASKASGGAGSPTKTPSGARVSGQEPVLLSKMSQEEFMEYRRTKRKQT